MTPNYQLFSGHFPVDHQLKRDDHDDRDHQQNHQELFFLKSQDIVASASSSPSSLDPIQEQGAGYYFTESHQLHHQQQAKIFESPEEPHEISKITSMDHSGLKLSISWKKEERTDGNTPNENNSVKWMSSKMRLMKKMMNSDHSTTSAAAAAGGDGVQIIRNNNSMQQKFNDDHHHLQKYLSSSSSLESNSNSYSNSFTAPAARVCADCNTTKTPLWRSGPRGPKSLCNACGIRQRKARRAMAAAENGIISSTSFKKSSNGTNCNNKTQQKEKIITSNNSCLPFKKRCKMVAGSASSPTQQQGKSKKKPFCIEDLTIILSKNSSFHQRVFPEEEKEAAILLMALSYGLVHG